MRGKIKLMWLVTLSSLLALTSGRTFVTPKPSPRLLVTSSYSSEKSGRSYEVLNAFVVNYSDDTLKFWSTNCHLTTFFSVTNNVYMHLTDEDCKSIEFEQMAIPPHRSQLIHLKMLIEKQPHEAVRLKVNMTFYHWFQSDDFKEDKKYHKPQILTDDITLRYDKDGNSFYTWADGDKFEQKEKLNLPTTKLHLLTEEERKLFTMTVDETKICCAHDIQYRGKNEEVFNVPVTVHNNSDQMLKYYSMTCSWVEFYRIDNKYLEIPGPHCIGNLRDEVIVPAHSMHTDTISFFCATRIDKKPLNFRIGLNINENVRYDSFGFDAELMEYNIVWSNQIQFTPK